MATTLEDEYFFMKKWDEIWKRPEESEAHKTLMKIHVAGINKHRADYGKFWEEDGVDVDTPEEIKNQLFFM